MHPYSFRKTSMLLLFLLLLIPALLAITPARQPTDSTLVSIIISGRGDVSSLHTAVRAAGGEIVRSFDAVGSVEARVPASSINRLAAAPEVLSVFPNREVASAREPQSQKHKKEQVPYDFYPEAMGLPEVWAQGLTGSGVTVAVVDSGIVQDARGKIDPFGSRLLASVNFAPGSDQDLHGHGTHVAALVGSQLCRGGTLRQSGCADGYQGVAPGANLVSVRVLDREGKGSYASVIAGVDWVLANKERYNIRVMNLSLTATPLSPYWADPLNQAVMRAWEAGIFVVAAAGNSGPGAGTITVPGNIPYVLTVGMLTDNYTPEDWTDDYVAPVSAAGPTFDGFLKPDVVAPGGHITSYMPRYTYLARTRRDNQVNKHFHTISGTSQATALVSGLAALMLEQEPGLTNELLKARIRGTALTAYTESGDPQPIIMQGVGRVYVPAAMASTIDEEANAGMDITTDLTTNTHYQGYLRWDEENGLYLVGEDGTTLLAGGPAVWSGGPAVWSGGPAVGSGGPAVWSGGPAVWSGGPAVWSGGPAVWSGGPAVWSGGTAVWSGGTAVWSGGPAVWSGGPAVWSGSWEGDMEASGINIGLVRDKQY